MYGNNDPEHERFMEEHERDRVNFIHECERKRRAQPAPVQEPDGYVSSFESGSPLMCGLSEWERKGLTAVYKAPHAAQRQWAGLTDEERMECIFSTRWSTTQLMDTSKAIEAKLKERNT